MNALRIGFAGMTHLGLNSAMAAAARGASVICYDGDEDSIAALASGKATVVEPDLEQQMVLHADRLAYTVDATRLATCAVVYVAPDVPTDDAGNSDLSELSDLIGRIDSQLPQQAVMVILSQVPPGFCANLDLRKGRALYYQVETLIFGQAVERALNPERFIIGCKHPDQPLNENYLRYLGLFGCPVLPMRYESAEMAKIAINCFLVSSVSTTNTLAELCESIGADWSEIIPSLRLDKRIGPFAYLTPGLGIAGGNLERDLTTVIALSDRHGTDCGVVRSWVHNSRHRKSWALHALTRLVLKELQNPTITVWGLAYKQNTHSTKNSAALELIRALAQHQLQVYDPVVDGVCLPDRFLKRTETALEACGQSDVLVIMTPWPHFSQIAPRQIAQRLRGRWVLDPYRVLDPKECRTAGLTYLTLGC